MGDLLGHARHRIWIFDVGRGYAVRLPGSQTVCECIIYDERGILTRVQSNISYETEAVTA